MELARHNLERELLNEKGNPYLFWFPVQCIVKLSCIVCTFTLYQMNATPLYWASQKGHHDVVHSLLGSGADVTIAVMPEVRDVILLPIE